ncbi:MAG: pseudouridine synthase [Rhizobiaceae bacterium]
MDDGKKKPGHGGKRPAFSSSASGRTLSGAEKRPRGRSVSPSSPRRGEGGSRSEPGEGGDSRQSPAERIAKRLARAGISSRREAEALIEAGRVRVNGTVLSSPAFNVEPQDRIEVDGTLIPAVERTRLFLFHKPAGTVTTNRDPQGRKTIFDCLPGGLPRLLTVGRLDINTEGLLLLTNDGGLARLLELPSTGWLRRYRVRVHGKVEPEALASLSQGIAVDGVFYGAVEATLDREQGSNAWLTLGLREGKNREVRNILGALGLDVTRLIRVSYGPFQLGELGEGEVLELKGRLLRDQLGERLIAEAGANFEAPVAKPFSNKPVRAGREPEQKRSARGAHPRVEEGGLIRNRKREREQRREDALDRLQTTRAPRFEKKRSGEKDRFQDKGRPDDDKKRETPARPRSSNVWMAPGARPAGKKKAEETLAPRPSGDRPARFSADRPDRRPAPGRKPDERRDRPRPPREEGRGTGSGDGPERKRPAGKPGSGRPRGTQGGSGPGENRPNGPRREGGRPGGARTGPGGFGGGSRGGSGGRPTPRGGPRRPPKKG